MRAQRWLYTLPLRLRSLFRRGKADQDLEEELGYHLDRRFEENVARGMSREEARYAALRSMGGMEQRKEECREALLVTLIGAAVEIGAALATTHLLADLIFGLTPRDPLTLAGSAVILLAVASFVAALPAWRASRVDPMVTLRYE